MAHIISSPTRLKTLSHLEQGVETYYSGTQAWNYRVRVSVSSLQSVRSCLCTRHADRNRVCNYSGTNLMKTLFIWCYALSYQCLTGYQRGWWIVFPSERHRGTGRDARLLLQHVAGASKANFQMITSGQLFSLFDIHPHQESLINFWIINLWPFSWWVTSLGGVIFLS